MPRSGSGVYSFPSSSFNPAVSGATPTAADWNTTAADLATAISASIASDGQTTTTVRVPFAAGIQTDTVTEKTAATGVTLDGTLLKDGGVDISGVLAASGQVAFPATQVPSSGANVLDDYEEGTWTPSDVSGASLSLTVNSAQYIKVGQMVHLSAHILFPSTADATAVSLGGLPFTSQTTTNAVWGGAVSYTDSGLTLSILVRSNATSFTLQKNDGTAATNANMSGKTIRIAIMYRAAA